MKKLSKKSGLLLVAAMATCAFVMPSMASASSWGVVNSEHTLDSPNLAFVSDFPLTTSCAATSFTTDVRSAAVLAITAVTFRGCTAGSLSGGTIGDCTVTVAATGLPWTATAITTTNIQIERVSFDVTLEQFPDSSSCKAAAIGIKIAYTGNVANAHWTGNGANQHELTFNNATGLLSHSVIGVNTPITTRGTVRDTQQSLTVTG